MKLASRRYPGRGYQYHKYPSVDPSSSRVQHLIDVQDARGFNRAELLPSVGAEKPGLGGAGRGSCPSAPRRGSATAPGRRASFGSVSGVCSGAVAW